MTTAWPEDGKQTGNENEDGVLALLIWLYSMSTKTVGGLARLESEWFERNGGRRSRMGWAVLLRGGENNEEGGNIVRVVRASNKVHEQLYIHSHICCECLARLLAA